MGIKMMHLVKSREEYLRLRNSGNQIANVSEARNGNSDAKRNLVEMNYSCLPASGGLLRGATRQSNSVGMDLDFDPTRPDYDQLMAELPAKVIGMKDELGLLMLERSATKGFHIVFRRRTEMSQVENLEWASRLIGVEFDKGAKDITRVHNHRLSRRPSLSRRRTLHRRRADRRKSLGSAGTARKVEGKDCPTESRCPAESR